ncbi:MAG: hypothetical protein HC933_10235 [Pleurocapsa sp. SU_196_0]|nr:hypothetical protein [Pleurocapsa sp. SU_196_0]
MKRVQRVLAVMLGLIVLGSASLADPGSGGGGPYKPCPTCRSSDPGSGGGGPYIKP